MKIDEELMRQRGVPYTKVVPDGWTNMMHAETLVPSLGSFWYGKIKHRSHLSWYRKLANEHYIKRNLLLSFT